MNKNPGFGAPIRNSPRGQIDYPSTMIFDENNTNMYSVRQGESSSRASQKNLNSNGPYSYIPQNPVQNSKKRSISV
jgi:hypothetical protein